MVQELAFLRKPTNEATELSEQTEWTGTWRASHVDKGNTNMVVWESLDPEM